MSGVPLYIVFLIHITIHVSAGLLSCWISLDEIYFQFKITVLLPKYNETHGGGKADRSLCKNMADVQNLSLFQHLSWGIFLLSSTLMVLRLSWDISGAKANEIILTSHSFFQDHTMVVPEYSTLLESP